MGWKTQEVRRNEVPDQKASMAVPSRSCEMMGRATLREVASRATTRMIVHKLMMAPYSRRPGLKFGGGGLSATRIVTGASLGR